MTYVWHLTFFGGCLALAGALEKKQKHSLFCVKTKSNSLTGKNEQISINYKAQFQK